ncbi:MAG TPA: CU044_2847 family protein [Acidimicrobiales bacterium]|nr:CU044_2847 family protein [Acidimicrobiales bacterium]
MANIVKVAAGDDTSVYFEVDEVPAGPERISRGGHVMAELDTRLTEALGRIRPAAQAIVAALSALQPAQVTIEFGLKLDAELGAIVAKTGVSGHFTVTLTLDRPQ